MDRKISFIVAVYNVGEYIESCLASISAQSGADFEAVVIDDGSTDGSGAICDAAAAKDGRFRVIHQENRGASAARNAGILAAQGEWLCFVDGDDLVADGFLRGLEPGNYAQSDLVYFGYSELLPGGAVRDVPREGPFGAVGADVCGVMMRAILNADVLGKNAHVPRGVSYSTPWAKLYRRAFLLENELRYTAGLPRGQDAFFNFQVLQHAPRCYVQDTPAYVYRINEASITNRYNTRAVENHRVLIAAFSDDIAAMADGSQFKASLDAAIVRWFLYCCKMDFCHPDNPKSFAVRRAEYLRLRNSEAFDEAFRDLDPGSVRSTVRIAAVLSKWKWFGLYSFAWRLYRRASGG